MGVYKQFGPNPFQIVNNVCFLGLTDKKGHIKHCTVIDAEDYPKVSNIRWGSTTTLDGRHYVRSSKHRVSLHRFIVGLKKQETLDHKNRNPLDNRKDNLRLCPIETQNHWNTGPNRDSLHGFKGVWYHKERDRYVARIVCNGVKHWIGSYKTKEEAALAFNDAAIKYQGEFAYLNNIPIMEVNHGRISM
ncbi:MAG TPA: AP2 domain-containing protein [Syntrophales bacterium]|nr:AP2 domain-containing protein [Syntrophales bacterium]